MENILYYPTTLIAKQQGTAINEWIKKEITCLRSSSCSWRSGSPLWYKMSKANIQTLILISLIFTFFRGRVVSICRIDTQILLAKLIKKRLNNWSWDIFNNKSKVNHTWSIHIIFLEKLQVLNYLCNPCKDKRLYQLLKRNVKHEPTQRFTSINWCKFWLNLYLSVASWWIYYRRWWIWTKPNSSVLWDILTWIFKD